MNYFSQLKRRITLTISLVIFVFSVLLAVIALTVIAAIMLSRSGLISNQGPESPFTMLENIHRTILPLLFISVLFGTSFSVLFSKKAIKPLQELIAAIHRVAEGDFTIRVNLKGIGELEDLSHSFNKMANELSSMETLRSDFVDSFSHEFKTPIVSIRGFAKLLKDDTLSPSEQQEYLDIIIAESERLAQLSSNVLNISKYENTEIITNKTKFRLDEQIRKCVLLTESKWSANDLSMSIELDEVYFIGDEDLTQQIWLNLLENAIKFSLPGGTLLIRLSSQLNGICFTIQDNGIGMDEHTMLHIFDKFYQGDESHTKAGNGLGLSIAKRIIELCNGSIVVQSELGKGSIFTVML